MIIYLKNWIKIGFYFYYLAWKSLIYCPLLSIFISSQEYLLRNQCGGRGWGSWLIYKLFKYMYIHPCMYGRFMEKKPRTLLSLINVLWIRNSWKLMKELLKRLFNLYFVQFQTRIKSSMRCLLDPHTFV